MKLDYNTSVEQALAKWNRQLDYHELNDLGRLVFDANHKGLSNISIPTDLAGVIFLHLKRTSTVS